MLRRFFVGIVSLFRGQPKAISRKVNPKLPKGNRFTREGTQLQYPVPCNLCNMICQDDGISFESLVREGMVYVEGGQMIQEHHLPSCPCVMPVQRTNYFFDRWAEAWSKSRFSS